MAAGPPPRSLSRSTTGATRRGPKGAGRRIAARSLVLLQSKGGVLPINTAKGGGVKEIAVIGAEAADPIYHGGRTTLSYQLGAAEGLMNFFIVFRWSAKICMHILFYERIFQDL